MVDELKQRRPRIVSPKDPAGEPDAYDYFAYAGAEQVGDLKEKIKAQEKQLFDVQTGLLMVDGNTTEVSPHDEKAPYCRCNRCELKRLKALKKSIEFGLRKLRALYGQMS